MLISEIEEAFLDEYDPPPPYEEEEEYDVFLFWPSYSPPLLIPAPCDAELEAFAVRGCPVAAPGRNIADLRPHMNSSYDAPPTSSRLSTQPPYFHLSFPTSRQRRAAELDGLALPVRLRPWLAAGNSLVFSRAILRVHLSKSLSSSRTILLGNWRTWVMASCSVQA